MGSRVFVASLGFLTKGPVDFLYTRSLLCLMGALWARAPFQSARHLSLDGGCHFMLVALPWYVVVYRSHGLTYVAPFFLRDYIGRFASETMWALPGNSLLFFRWRRRFLPVVGSDPVRSRPSPCGSKEGGAPLKSLEFGLPLFLVRLHVPSFFAIQK